MLVRPFLRKVCARVESEPIDARLRILRKIAATAVARR